MGKNKKPTYRIIVSEKTKDTFGDYLEALGFYNPRSNPKIVDLDAERTKYWISKGAKASATVHNILVDQKIVAGPKVKASNLKKKTGEEAKAAAPAAAPAAATPAAAPAPTPAPAAEAPKA
jgi:small subunit ribosomal protein S16